MSIVPGEKVARNPQTLLYHFPSMHAVRYQKIMQEYTYWKHVQTAERVAEMNGCRLVPSHCIHWSRKRELESRKVMIQKYVFFVLKESEMTKAERRKYKQSLIRPEEEKNNM